MASAEKEVDSSVNITRSTMVPKKEEPNTRIRKKGPISINSKGNVIRFIKDRKIFFSDRQWTTPQTLVRRSLKSKVAMRSDRVDTPRCQIHG